MTSNISACGPLNYAEFYVVCPAHCNVIIRHKTTKCTFPILIIRFLNFLCLLHVSNQRARLQEDGGIYIYGMVCFTAVITIEGL
jgi:hypothetical protein